MVRQNDHQRLFSALDGNNEVTFKKLLVYTCSTSRRGLYIRDNTSLACAIDQTVRCRQAIAARSLLGSHGVR